MPTTYIAITGILSTLFWVLAEYLSLIVRRIDRKEEGKKKEKNEKIKARFERFARSVEQSKMRHLVFLALANTLHLKRKLFVKTSKWLLKTKMDEKMGCLSIFAFILLMASALTLVIAALGYPECQTMWSFKFCYPDPYAKQYCFFTVIALEAICVLQFLFFKEPGRNFLGHLWDLILKEFMVQPFIMVLGVVVIVFCFSLHLGLWLSILPLGILSVYVPKFLTTAISLVAAGHPLPDPEGYNSDNYEEEVAEARRDYPNVIEQSGGLIFAFFFGFFGGFYCHGSPWPWGNLFRQCRKDNCPSTFPCWRSIRYVMGQH